MSLVDDFYLYLQANYSAWAAGRTVIDRGSAVAFPPWVAPQASAPAADAYWTLDILGASERPLGSGSNRSVLASGILQIAAMAPKSRGIGLPMRILAAIRPRLTDDSENLLDIISAATNFRVQAASNQREAIGLPDGWTGQQIDCTVFYQYIP